MKLNRVEILGFKSFAEKTVIEFHEGITCVVGPNGCGKSNIGDAIRWVLGEQSAKALRGGKMPDVIFAGASSKKALNFAEVTITFSDVQGVLPLDYEEVAVTRRLHRSGESEYFINKQPVRLKDVHSLFLDSGIGKNNISFFEQGKIDQLIQYSPEERRYIFEEAAGIVRFLQRKRETMRKLEEVTLNLSRVADIQGEIEKQVASLEQQAEAASLYKKNKGQLEIFEKEHLALRYATYAKKRDELIAKETEAKKRQKEITAQKDHVGNSLIQKKQAHEDLEDAYRVARDELLTKKSEKELKTQLQLHSDERIKELIASENKMSLELEHLDKQKEGWLAEMAHLRKHKETLSAAVNEITGMVSKEKQEFQTLEKDLLVLQKKQTEAYREKVTAFQKQASLQSEVKQIVYRVEANLEKKEQFEARSANLTQLLQEKEREAKRQKEEFLSKELLVKAVDQQFNHLEGLLKTLLEEVKSAKGHLESTVKEFHEKSAKLKALMHLRQEFSGFTGGGKKLLQESEKVTSPIYHLLQGLYTYIHPLKGYEKAVSSALKSYSQTLVVNSKQDLDRVLAFAKEQTLFDFSLICLELIPSRAPSPYIQNNALGQHLLQFLSFEDSHEKAFNRAFINGESSWLSEEAYVDEKGVLFVGGPKDSSVFLREVEIKELESERQKLLQKREGIEAELSVLLQKEGELQLQRAELDAEQRKNALVFAESRFVLQKTESELEKIGKEKKEVDEEVKGLFNLMRGMKVEQQKVQDTAKAFDVSLEKIQKHLDEVESELASKVALTNSKKAVLQEMEKKQSLLDNDYRKTSHQHQLLEAKNAETDRLSLRLKGDLEAGKKGIAEWKTRLESNKTDLSTLTRSLETIHKNTEQVEQMRLESKQAIQIEELAFKDLERQLKEIENRMHQTGIQLAHVETGQNAVTIEMQERFQMGMIEPSLNLSQERLEKEIQGLKIFLEQHQNVNLAAIEECEKQRERKTFLEAQVSDLSQAKLELLKMITGLDEESRQLFKATFQEIRQNFRKNFQILFKGGEADLELLKADDILETGIEITAKPPGKQMRSLSLLSGGEKCLTAMALLFAIFEVKTSPFCILDEIDAPLDDSNVERFLNVVKQFIDRCQFIIVTHNKRTMALADRLYGVSMEEKGISKLLFMEFSEKSTELAGV